MIAVEKLAMRMKQIGMTMMTRVRVNFAKDDQCCKFRCLNNYFDQLSAETSNQSIYFFSH